MPTDTTHVLRSPRRDNPTVRGRALTSPALPKVGSLTQSFFARGEEQEASGYQNLAADDPLLAPPELEFDSFDKIPRRRGSWFAIAVSLLVVAAVGVVTWRSFHFLSRPGSSVAAASRAMVQAPPAPQPAPMTVAQPEPAQPESALVPALPEEEPQAAVSAPPAKEPARAVPAPRAKEPARAIPAPIVVPLIVRPVRHSAPAKHEAPLRGYVWSPEKRTLVPAEPAVEDQLPGAAPQTQSLDGAPAEEPQPPRESTTPAPFQSPRTPVPSESAPIIE